MLFVKLSLRNFLHSGTSHLCDTTVGYWCDTTGGLGIGVTRQMVWVLGNRAYIARVRIDHFENTSNRMTR